MIYEVYAGGIHAVQSQMDIDFSKKDRYDIFMSAYTRGFLGRLVPWKGTFESHGWNLDDNDLRPELHRSADTWRGEGEIKEYHYTKDRKFKSLVVTDHKKKPRDDKADDELTQGTTDALTAALMVMRKVAAGKKCEGTSEVFDGKRRFKMIFRDQGTVNLKSSKYNIYHGPAAECTVEVVPIAGAWHKKPRGWLSIQEQGRDRGLMPTVWMASIDGNATAVPVKIRIKTAYGTLFMHLAEYNDGRNITVAQKRSEREEE